MVELYFAFGANVHPRTLARRSIAPRAAHPARLDGHRLVFDQPGLPLLEPSFASVRESRDSRVWGVLYELEPEALARLRAFEGDEYVERPVTVDVVGESLEARTFVTRGAHRERRPSRRYLRLIRAGAEHHLLPEEWLAHLDALPCLYVPVVHDLWATMMPLVDHVHRRLASPSRRA